MLEALKNRVVVEPIISQEQKTGSGIILALSEGEYTDTGIITSIGKDVKGFEIGDKVLLPHLGLNPINKDNKEYIAIYAEDILGKIEMIGKGESTDGFSGTTTDKV